MINRARFRLLITLFLIKAFSVESWFRIVKMVIRQSRENFYGDDRDTMPRKLTYSKAMSINSKTTANPC